VKDWEEERWNECDDTMDTQQGWKYYKGGRMEGEKVMKGIRKIKKIIFLIIFDGPCTSKSTTEENSRHNFPKYVQA
jgi:hypothetical protein